MYFKIGDYKDNDEGYYVCILDSEIRELAQKPHAPHAAFLHCAKLRGFCPVSSMFL
jgi:hypothetical protein